MLSAAFVFILIVNVDLFHRLSVTCITCAITCITCATFCSWVHNANDVLKDIKLNVHAVCTDCNIIFAITGIIMELEQKLCELFKILYIGRSETPLSLF